MKNLLIVGSGALACLFGAHLSRAGLRVFMLDDWQAGIQALQRHGIRYTNSEGIEEVFPVTASTAPTDLPKFDHSLVLVKSWQTQAAAKMLKAALSPTGTALTLQNGLGNRETLQKILIPDIVLLGTTTSGASLTAPGRVRFGGAGPVNIEDTAIAKPYQAVLRLSGFDVIEAENISSLIWQKLIVNAGINPLTALLNIPNGALLKSEFALETAAALAGETAAVANASGVQLPEVNPVELVKQVVEKTAANYSSMLQDIRRGAPTEIDAICGEIVRIGRQHLVSVPVNELVLKLVKAKIETTEENYANHSNT